MIKLLLLVLAVAGLLPMAGDARGTQLATRARLEVLGDAFTCTEARFVSYRRSNDAPEIVDHWYVASQIWADVVLTQAVERGLEVSDWDAATERCYIEKAHLFLDRQWDYAGFGGYFPRSNPTGTRVESEDRFGDDNALTGLMLLDLLEVTSEPSKRQQYLHAARRQADFLIKSGLWDETFGGGFWWNTTRGSSLEGKPAQTNALAALFFGRLYQATDDPEYRSWMQRTLLWLDTILFDPSVGLYRWSVRYQDLAAKSGATVGRELINYDQSIAIEAQLVAAEIDGDPSRLPRALAVGEAVQTSFWIPERGYSLGARGQQIYTSYGAWTSLGHLALFDATGDRRWLELADANLAAMTRYLREPDGGFALQAFNCVDELARFCQPGQTGWVIDYIRDGAAQAWTQRLQTELARRQPSMVPN